MSKEAIEILHKEIDRLFKEIGGDYQLKVRDERGVSKYKNKALSFVFLSYQLNNIGLALTDDTLRKVLNKRGYEIGRGSPLVEGYPAEFEIEIIYKPLASNALRISTEGI